jgi:hypothetical protein
MLIWMLYFLQQLGGLSKFTPGSPYHQFIFNLADAVRRSSFLQWIIVTVCLDTKNENI